MHVGESRNLVVCAPPTTHFFICFLVDIFQYFATHFKGIQFTYKKLVTIYCAFQFFLYCFESSFNRRRTVTPTSFCELTFLKYFLGYVEFFGNLLPPCLELELLLPMAIYSIFSTFPVSIQSLTIYRCAAI